MAVAKRLAKKAPAVAKRPATGLRELRQKALELAVNTNALDIHHNYGGSISGYGPPYTTRRYAAEAEILKTAKAFLAFMQGE